MQLKKSAQRAASRQQNEETESRQCQPLDLCRPSADGDFKIASEDSLPSPSRTTPAPSGAQIEHQSDDFFRQRSIESQPLGAHAGEDVADVNSKARSPRAVSNLKLLEHTYQSAEDAKVEELRKRKLRKLEALRAQRRANLAKRKKREEQRARDLAEGEARRRQRREQQQQLQQQQQPFATQEMYSYEQDMRDMDRVEQDELEEEIESPNVIGSVNGPVSTQQVQQKESHQQQAQRREDRDFTY